MLPLSWLANYLRDAKLSGPQLQQAQSSNSSRFNRQENLCRFGIFSYHHIIRPCSINTTYSSDFLCYPSGSCQQNIFLKLKNDSRKHVGLNPLPRAHYYPAQPDHLYFPIHSQYFVLQATYRQNQNSSQSQQWINSEEKENCSQQQVFSTPRVNLGVTDTWGHWAPYPHLPTRWKRGPKTL